MKWLSIEQELPAKGQRMLLCTQYSFFGHDYSCVGDRESLSAGTVSEGRCEVPIFTHGMPWPPKSEQYRNGKTRVLY